MSYMFCTFMCTHDSRMSIRSSVLCIQLLNASSEELYAGGPLRQYRACAGISSEWSYVTASPSRYDPAISILSPVLFMHVGQP